MACKEVEFQPAGEGTLYFRCFAANANKLAFNVRLISEKSVINSYKIFPFFLGLAYNTCGKGWPSILFSLRPLVVFILILCMFCTGQSIPFNAKFNLKRS